MLELTSAWGEEMVEIWMLAKSWSVPLPGLGSKTGRGRGGQTLTDNNDNDDNNNRVKPPLTKQRGEAAAPERRQVKGSELGGSHCSSYNGLGGARESLDTSHPPPPSHSQALQAVVCQSLLISPGHARREFDPKFFRLLSWPPDTAANKALIYFALSRTSKGDKIATRGDFFVTPPLISMFKKVRSQISTITSDL